MSDPLASPSTPLSIGRFQVLKVLDHGPYTTLYLAQDQGSQRLVTLKTATPGTETPGLAERLHRVLEANRRLDHPGVLHVIELGRDPASGPFLVMDHLEGTCLASLLAGGIPAFPALHLLIQIVHVMEFAAGAGIHHGDLQPRSIWVTLQGEVRLLGFGTPGASPHGSEGYGAPERLDDGASSARADQFSLAATAFHLLSGKPPFHGISPEEVARAVRVGRLSLPSKMPMMMQKVFLKAMDKDPNGRYATFRDFMAVLIAAAPLEEHHLEDLLSFLDGKPLAFEGLEFLSVREATPSEEPRVTPPIPIPLENPAPAREGTGRLGSKLLDAPGVIGFAAFNESGALLTSSPHSGDLADLAPSVYFRLADSIFGSEGGSKVRHFLFRTKQGMRYILHRRAHTLIVIKLKADANLQEILRGLDDGFSLN